ncbi:MAG: aminoglycoside adenylyltransferase domain-containing protein [Anaerolineae bacterium]
MLAQPTPYPDVNAVLSRFLERLYAALGDDLVGLYLYGSLASGDFDRESSDIDFVVVTADDLGPEAVERLRWLHADLAATGGRWGRKLEGAYIARAALRRYDPAYRQPFLSEDTPFGITELGADWVINRHTLREQGIVLYGPDPATLIDPVSAADIIAAVRGEMEHSWRPFLLHHERLRSRRYQSFAVLTLCRALYAFEHGELVSKPVAAAWALAHLAPEWAGLVGRALSWRHDDSVDEASLVETLGFLRYALARYESGSGSDVTAA